jgi:hypothetical protein
MKEQGLSNNEIIQNLTRQGYSNTEIFDAMNHLDTKNAVESSPSSLMSFPSETVDNLKHQTSAQDFTNNSNVEEEIEHYDPKTEELIETIIDEKWQELLKDVNKIIEWKNRSERRIQEVEIQIKNLKESFDELHKAVIGKVSEYDKHILDVGTEIKAMEKVFSKVLPKFTENVHELSRITKKVKEQEEN